MNMNIDDFILAIEEDDIEKVKHYIDIHAGNDSTLIWAAEHGHLKGVVAFLKTFKKQE